MFLAREIRNRIQLSRKKRGCVPTDKVKIYFNTPDGDNEIKSVLNSEKESVKKNLEFKIFQGQPQEGEVVFGGEPYEDNIGEIPVSITLVNLN